jgi:inorganic phosphate transporter, PiT family
MPRPNANHAKFIQQYFGADLLSLAFAAKISENLYICNSSVMLLLTCLLAFYLAWNLGANDVANSMGTSVGSKAVTLRQALVIAGVLEFLGAVLFGQKVSATLATQIVNPIAFAQATQMFLLGMVAVLLACGIWLNAATHFGWPVSSSHAVVGAIAGFGWVALGWQAVDWRSLGVISLTWMVTPAVSGAIAAVAYRLVQRFILQQPDPAGQLQEWIPWLSSSLVCTFGVLVLPHFSQPIHHFLSDRCGLVLPLPIIPLGMGAIALAGLTATSWATLAARVYPLSQITATSLEPVFARFQLLSACFVAFAHGSNDVGNAVAPLAAIAYVQTTGTVPTEGFVVPIWILLLGGGGIVAGLGVWGKRVISTIGEKITPLQPSGGFCAELATAATVLCASQFGLPVSTSHALVGAVVGVGLVNDRATVQLATLKPIALAWLITIPIAASLSAIGFCIFTSFWSAF